MDVILSQLSTNISRTSAFRQSSRYRLGDCTMFLVRNIQKTVPDVFYAIVFNMILWQVIADWGNFNEVQKVKTVLTLDFQKLNEIYIDPNYTHLKITSSLIVSSQLCGGNFSTGTWRCFSFSFQVSVWNTAFPVYYHFCLGTPPVL